MMLKHFSCISNGMREKATGTTSSPQLYFDVLRECGAQG